MAIRYRPMLVVIVALSALGVALVTFKQGDESALQWDLSDGRSLKLIDWPDEIPDSVRVATLDHPGHISIKLPDGRAFAGRAKSVHVWRVGDNVGTIKIHHNNLPLESAYHSASKLIRQFDAPDDLGLDAWFEASKMARGGGVAHKKYWFSTHRMHYGIEMLHSFDKRKPWVVSFSISFLESYPD